MSQHRPLLLAALSVLLSSSSCAPPAPEDVSIGQAVFEDGPRPPRLRDPSGPAEADLLLAADASGAAVVTALDGPSSLLAVAPGMRLADASGVDGRVALLFADDEGETGALASFSLEAGEAAHPPLTFERADGVLAAGAFDVVFQRDLGEFWAVTPLDGGATALAACPSPQSLLAALPDGDALRVEALARCEGAPCLVRAELRAGEARCEALPLDGPIDWSDSARGVDLGEAGRVVVDARGGWLALAALDGLALDPFAALPLPATRVSAAAPLRRGERPLVAALVQGHEGQPATLALVALDDDLAPHLAAALPLGGPALPTTYAAKKRLATVAGRLVAARVGGADVIRAEVDAEGALGLSIEGTLAIAPPLLALP